MVMQKLCGLRPNIQLVGIALDNKRIIRNSVAVQLTQVYWFGEVEDLNLSSERIICLEEDTAEWYPRQSLHLLKKALNE